MLMIRQINQSSNNALCGSKGDHGSIVRTQLKGWKKGLRLAFNQCMRKFRSEQSVRADATCDNETF